MRSGLEEIVTEEGRHIGAVHRIEVPEKILRAHPVRFHRNDRDVRPDCLSVTLAETRFAGTGAASKHHHVVSLHECREGLNEFLRV